MSAAPAAAAHPGGLLLLDKAAGWSSTRALGRAKRILGQRKGGHTGTLDPFATGLLPLAFGEATKFSRFLIDAPKGYEAVLCLGRTSTTGDPEGEISPQLSVSIERAMIEDVLGSFTGVQQQVPPMHSAGHHEGKRLYDLARAGVEVDRAPRTITIHAIRLLSIVGEKVTISVKCSKGTYIRVLGQDIGARLGCGAYLTELRRTQVAGFGVESSLSLEELEAEVQRGRIPLLPCESLVAGLPREVLGPEQAQSLCHGQAVSAPGLPAGHTALFGPGGSFLGVGEADGAGALAPLRLLAPADGVRRP